MHFYYLIALWKIRAPFSNQILSYYYLLLIIFEHTV